MSRLIGVMFQKPIGFYTDVLLGDLLDPCQNLVDLENMSLFQFSRLTRFSAAEHIFNILQPPSPFLSQLCSGGWLIPSGVPLTVFFFSPRRAFLALPWEKMFFEELLFNIRQLETAKALLFFSSSLI